MQSAKERDSFPFDERNQDDFVQITKRIQDALEQFAKDRRLKRTEANLARLADCSRGTLRNRAWPLVQLQKLKEEAKQFKKAKNPENAAPRSLREKSRIDRYREQLEKNRDELLVWKYKHDDLRAKVQTLEEQRDILKRRAEALEARLRAVTIAPKLATTVPFSTPPLNSPETSRT